MIGVAIGAAVLLILVIGILILYRRKSTESNRVLKNMQEQVILKIKSFQQVLFQLSGFSQ
jgi:hypothetical protein